MNKYALRLFGNDTVKRYTIQMAHVFSAALVVGYFFPHTEFFTYIIAYLQELVASASGTDIYFIILFNNLRMAAVTILLGVTVFYPYMAVFFNGYILGGVVSMVGLNAIWKILPHGIFEIPAIILACALGAYLGAYGNKMRFKLRLIFVLRRYMIIIVPLLIVAALVEGSLVYFLT